MGKNYIGNLRKAWLILKAMPTEGGSAKAALGPDRNHRRGVIPNRQTMRSTVLFEQGLKTAREWLLDRMKA
jgi:hypothetical protein